MALEPAVSIIVPFHSGTSSLERCLAALADQATGVDEIIVVDDASVEDVSSVVARFAGLRVFRLDRHAGVAAARNRGASEARRPLLLFVDADVVAHGDLLSRGRARMEDSAVDALIGSYDEAPAADTLVSRFKNLAHHHFHQRAAGAVSSFWGACGFIRREVFWSVGGFDERRFVEPSIEDVELGWRLTDRGAAIVLDPSLQVTHLKRWTLRSFVATDIGRRAIPWVRGALERGRLPVELNATIEQRVASVLAVALVVAAVAAVPFAAARLPLLVIAAAALAINWRLFALLRRKGGLPLLVAGFFLQQVYYVCALAGTVAGVLLWMRQPHVRAPDPAARSLEP